MTEKDNGLTWKDYLAIIIAMLTTTLLPIFLFLGILLAVVIVIVLT
ncbi:MAG: hypothetical protein NWF11_04810 [Candidatus Bathyarchaeota archaeon]|nr:hypothetical protein [Candidatus Bathyarchaeota archaeon]